MMNIIDDISLIISHYKSMQTYFILSDWDIIYEKVFTWVGKYINTSTYLR